MIGSRDAAVSDWQRQLWDARTELTSPGDRRDVGSGPRGSGLYVPCGDCGGRTDLTRDHRGRLFWTCADCGSNLKADEHGYPVGIPADVVTRQMRKKVHALFDRIWQDGELGRMSKAGAYRWLAEQLGVSEGEAHMGKMGVDQLLRAWDILKRELPGKHMISADIIRGMVRVAEVLDDVRVHDLADRIDRLIGMVG